MALDAQGADLIIRADRIYPFDGTGRTYSTVAVRGNSIAALGEGPNDLAELAAPSTHVIEVDGVVMPGFYDTHVHQFEGGLELRTLQVSHVTSVRELVELVAEAAADLPEGEWIVTSRNWHESALDERRLPTAAELDEATDRHPVCVRRGSHLAVANSSALRLAGLPPSDGQLFGDEAISPVVSLIAEPSFDDKVQALKKICGLFNEYGIVAARDPGIATNDFLVYQALRERQKLTVRSTVMVRMDEGWPLEAIIAEIDRWGIRTGFGDEMLRIGGVKLFVDGRIEDGALRTPYPNTAEFYGNLYLPRRVLEQAVRHAVSRGWDVGCHAVGDAALEVLIGAYEAVLRDFPQLRHGALIIEHALLAPAELRRRVVELGIGVSIHPPLMYAFGADMLRYWGEELTETANPAREWLDEGALIAAGSDGCVPPFDPRLAIWNLVTRGTKAAGVLGQSHAIDVESAFELYTVAGARLLREDSWRGPLRPGLRADFVIFDRDPLLSDPDELPELGIAATCVDGAFVYDKLGSFASLNAAGVSGTGGS